MGSYNIELDALAPMIFLKNVNNLPIEINIREYSDLKNGKDMFFFLIDLFFKGLYYSRALNDVVHDEKITLNDITLEEIFTVISKMKNANIIMHLEYIESIDDWELCFKRMLESSYRDAKLCDDSISLEQLHFKLPFNDSLYKISFELRF